MILSLLVVRLRLLRLDHHALASFGVLDLVVHPFKRVAVHVKLGVPVVVLESLSLLRNHPGHLRLLYFRPLSLGGVTLRQAVAEGVLNVFACIIHHHPLLEDHLLWMRRLDQLLDFVL